MDKSNWDVDFRYVFSGSLTNKMRNLLQGSKNFEPLDILISQVTRNELENAIKWKQDGFARWVFCDSGAFSVHTGKANITADDYVEYLKTIIDDIDVCAQLDTLPGTFGQPKTEEDYINSAEESWDNFLWMRSQFADKNKVMPVFHYGEDIKYLIRMLNYVDNDGDHLDYIGISPANDESVKSRMLYLRDVYNVISESDNPNVKTHLYGFTSLEAISKFPCYSADSISHRLVCGYNKLFTESFGIISSSRGSRSTKGKSSQSFLETADEYNLKKLRDEIHGYGYTPEYVSKFGYECDDILDVLPDSNDLRVAISVRAIQRLERTKYKYKDSNLVRTKKLF